MDKNNGLVGCLAIVGGFVVVYALLSVFWGLAVGFGPLGFAALMAVVFARIGREVRRSRLETDAAHTPDVNPSEATIGGMQRRRARIHLINPQKGVGLPRFPDSSDHTALPLRPHPRYERLVGYRPAGDSEHGGEELGRVGTERAAV